MPDSYGRLCRESGGDWRYNEPLNPKLPDCDGIIQSGPGGGIVCPKCGAWFCY